MDQRARIDRITTRRILDSHARPTLEFEVLLADGRVGRGSAPRGETPSLYEDRIESGLTIAADASALLVTGEPWTQEQFDARIQGREGDWGRRATLAISVAMRNALHADRPPVQDEASMPGIVYNLINGGLHAYTNPVRADITELLLVPRDVDVWSATEAFLAVEAIVRRRLDAAPIVRVGDNDVHDVGTDGERGAIDLALAAIAEARVEGAFELMIDASAGDWRSGSTYRLPVSGIEFDGSELWGRWRALAAAGLRYLEDPFAEADLESWQRARADSTDLQVLGDNFTSSRRDLLESGRAELIDGIVLKPDQAGTVTEAVAVADAARRAGLFVIASHRSIETESLFLIDFALATRARYLKIGPLRDFSAVVKLNELLRRSPA